MRFDAMIPKSRVSRCSRRRNRILNQNIVYVIRDVDDMCADLRIVKIVTKDVRKILS